jgi:hypothetical protein
MAAKGMKTIHYPPYLPDVAPAYFVLFAKVKSELAGLLLSQDGFKMSWGRGGIRTIAKKEFAANTQHYIGC